MLSLQQSKERGYFRVGWISEQAFCGSRCLSGPVTVYDRFTTTVVVQLMIAPLRAVRIKSLMAALKRRRRIFAVTSLLVLMLILPGSVLFVIPGFASEQF